MKFRSTLVPFLCLFGSLILLSSCKPILRPGPHKPNPTATPTLVQTATNTPTSTHTLVATSTPTWTPSATPVATQSLTSTPFALPSPIMPFPTPESNATPDPNLNCNIAVPVTLSGGTAHLPYGNSFLNGIRSQSDWEDWCGTTTPPPAPVNFNQQMIIPVSNTKGCTGTSCLTSICVNSTQIVLTFSVYVNPHPVCWSFAYTPAFFAIPQSNLPIVRQGIQVYGPTCW